MTQPQPAHVLRAGATSALLLLLLINLFNYLDRYALAAIEPEISSRFDLTEEKTGLLASGFLIAYMFAAPLLGRLAERVSRWKLIAASIVIWSLATGTCGLSGFAGAGRLPS
jgi:MFS family permease